VSADFSDFIHRCREQTGEHLQRRLNSHNRYSASQASNNQLLAAISYSLLNGGKRVRPGIGLCRGPSCRHIQWV